METWTVRRRTLITSIVPVPFSFMTLPTQNSKSKKSRKSCLTGKEDLVDIFLKAKPATNHQDGKSNPRKLNSSSNDIELVQKFVRWLNPRGRVRSWRIHLHPSSNLSPSFYILPGATPQTPSGWCRLRILGLFRLKSVFSPLSTPTAMIQPQEFSQVSLNGVDLVQSSLAPYPSGRWIKERKLKPLNGFQPCLGS
jgi:hypothetical protein